jgi:ectoine hydroxylase-related dioxygenase (phytanoyl-CoA dioxygenase family)
MTSTVADTRTQLAEAGYAVVEDVFRPETDFAAVYGEWDAILDGIAQELVADGTLDAPPPDLPFAERLMALCAETGRSFHQPFDISLPQTDITPDTALHVGPAVFELLTHERLLDVVEQLIGPELVSNPVQHVRMKPPGRLLGPERARSYLAARVPWHQDLGVLLPEADSSTILSCWVAFTDTDEENGCMQVVPGSHRRDLYDHCPTEPQTGIPEHLLALDGAVTLPMRAGSVLFFGQNLLHGSLDNVSHDRVRISMDLRYQPAGQPSGRPQFPSFLARSRAYPEQVLHDPAVWAEMWFEARDALSRGAVPAFTRWHADAPFCA